MLPTISKQEGTWRISAKFLVARAPLPSPPFGWRVGAGADPDITFLTPRCRLVGSVELGNQTDNKQAIHSGGTLNCSDGQSLLVIITILIMANIIIESRLKILHAALANPTGSVRLLKKFSKSENQRDK